MAKYKIVYEEEEDEGEVSDVVTLVLPDGRRSEPMDLPETGIGLVTVGNEMFALVTPEHDGEGNHLLHDTVYRLTAVDTEVEGDFPEYEELPSGDVIEEGDDCGE